MYLSEKRVAQYVIHTKFYCYIYFYFTLKMFIFTLDNITVLFMFEQPTNYSR